MTGLLRREFETLLAMQRKSLLFLFLAYGLLLLTGAGRIAFLLIIILGALVLNLFSADDASGWNRYVRTLPVTARQVVAARYLTMLAVLAVGTAFLAVLSAAVGLLRQEPLWAEEGALLTAAAGLGLLFHGSVMAASYRWGVEKARTAVAVIGGVLLALILLPTLFNDGPGFPPSMRFYTMSRGYETHDSYEAWEAAFVSAAGVVLLAAGALAFAVSFWISCRVYHDREP